MGYKYVLAIETTRLITLSYCKPILSQMVYLVVKRVEKILKAKKAHLLKVGNGNT